MSGWPTAPRAGRRDKKKAAQGSWAASELQVIIHLSEAEGGSLHLHEARARAAAVGGDGPKQERCESGVGVHVGEVSESHLSVNTKMSGGGVS